MPIAKDASIYLAGHRGLVGSAVLRKLKDEGFYNLITASKDELNLKNQLQVDLFFESKKPEYVILAAAKVGGILANNRYKAEFIYDNTMIAANVVDAAYHNGVKRLLNLGSSCIYPKHCHQPMKEEYLLTGELEPTNEPYALAKIVAIKLCSSYNFQYGTDFVSLMPTNLYGTNDNYNLETSHVLPALLRKMILGKYLMDGNFDAIMEDVSRYPLGFGLTIGKDSGEKDIINSLEDCWIGEDYIKIWGTGNVMREFLHVSDLAGACTHFLNKDGVSGQYDFVNIGTGKEISIIKLAELIQSITGYSGELHFDATRPDGTPRKLLDISRAREFGWSPKIDLEDGIILVYQDYMSKK